MSPSHSYRCVCAAGAELLLRAEGARLSDEERAGSSGNHQAEPALGGAEPAHAPEVPLTLLRPVSPLRQRQAAGAARRHDNSSVCTIVGPRLLNSLHPGRATLIQKAQGEGVVLHLHSGVARYSETGPVGCIC